mgnify:CR=1 FL=1
MTITLRPHQDRILDRMLAYNKGQIIVPTGGGKTLTMIVDTQRRHDVVKNGTTTVVVAPRILLAEQLCSEFLEVVDTFNTHIMHVHSGETQHFSTTKADQIHIFASVARTAGENVIIFTTYHSLHRLMEADIEVNTIYFDEAHNSVQRNFFPATEFFANDADRCYFYTATPKHSLTVSKPGMNDGAVYGQVLVNVPAPELVKQGYILPPKVVVKQLPMIKGRKVVFADDCDNLIETIDDNSIDKTLICARTTKQIINLLTHSDFCLQLKERGYSWMTITSKTGAIIDGKKVNRDVFFDTLNTWGKDKTKKFVVLHHSILSEGINVPGLTHTILLRNLPVIEMAQTIGRVIRLHKDDAQDIAEGKIIPGDLVNYRKSHGVVTVPLCGKASQATRNRLQKVIELIFVDGLPAHSFAN